MQALMGMPRGVLLESRALTPELKIFEVWGRQQNPIFNRPGAIDQCTLTFLSIGFISGYADAS